VRNGKVAIEIGGLRWFALLASLSAMLVGCSAAPAAAPATQAPTPQPTARVVGTAVATTLPRPVSTATSAATTGTPAPAGTSASGTTVPGPVDYKALCQPLLLPLGALIVAVRAKTPTTTYWLAEFNRAADKVLPAIEGDQSTNANRLRTAIANIRAMPNNLQVLEDSRSSLLMVG
jgi:hypothetical protein